MVEQRVKFLGFGFPDFGEHVYKQHEAFFQHLPAAQDALNSLTHRAYKEVAPHQKVILNLCMLTGRAMVEIVTLAGNGMGQGAMKILRGMMENGINAEYLRQFPKECEDYLDWHWIELNKFLTWAKERNPKLYREIEPKAKENIARNFAKVKDKFKNRESWCSLNLFDRASRAGCETMYRLVMPHANQILHGTIGGLGHHFNVEEDVHRISIPPSDQWIGEALIAAHQVLLATIETLSKTFDAQPEPVLQSLIDDFRTVWKDALAQQGREEPS